MSIHEIFDTKTRDHLNSFMSSFTGKMLGSMIDLVVKAVNSAEYDNVERNEAASIRFPNEASTKELFHYGQIVDAKQFQSYDYGDQNQAHYG